MKLRLTFFSICVILAAAVLIMGRCRSDSKSDLAVKENIPHHNDYIGDQQCKSCHASQYDDWLQSDHFKAMQEASDSTVLGDFNNVSYKADGVTSVFFKKDGKFFINTRGDDGKNHDYEIKYTFGYYPLQQYLIEFPGGRMQATRASWDSRTKKWFHQYAGQKIDSRDWLHWTRNAQTWNTMCAECHSTNLKKNYNIESDSYHTTYSVINVSCEACHGPGKLHVDYINSTAYKEGKKAPDAYMLLNKESSQISQINTCAPCHAVKGNISPDLIASDELLDNYIPVVPNTERFYADGQMNEEDYNYAPFLQSKMFRNNVKCSNCHNPHSGRVYFTTNQLCLQCHNKSYDDPSHTFHAINTAGAECKSCHMPSKTYMGNDLRHDHSFRVPRPDLSVAYATPNACNSCHTDKTAQWAAKAVEKWYGSKRKYHFAEDLIPGSKMDAESEAHLVKLLSDTSVPRIIKATAANYLGGIATESSLQHLLNCLQHEDAQVRYEALRSLMNFSPHQFLNDIAPLLDDKVRAVRIAAADLFSSIPRQEIPSAYASSYTKANAELMNYLLYQADFAHGNVSIADYYMRTGDPGNAEKFYLRVLKKDSLVNLPRLNLSILYNSQGRNKEALQVLETAAKIDNKNPQIFYNLALLQNEMKNPAAAIENFQKALDLKMQDQRLYYNYGLLLHQSGNSSKAIGVLETGLKVNPSSANINYALAYVYLQVHQVDKARQYAQTLKRLDPNNPDYQGLFATLGIR
ncbi:MAG: tetratricopeptide repeat protein [Chitinophagaceae bacterium]|nr:tetratricopeptide repeat protein [Chitinophagaceae bacterium]